MNWGTKITIVIFTFIFGMLSMVYISFRQKNEMMDENYYDKEMKYQGNIDGAKNMNALGKASCISQNDASIILSLPKSVLQNFEQGRLEFLRTSDQNKDVVTTYIPDANGEYKISKSKFKKGFYMVRIRFNSQSKEYYKEEKLYVL